MIDVLEQIVKDKREELSSISFGNIEELARNTARQTISMAQSILGTKGGIIAEYKRYSPSKKWINKDANVCDVAQAYEESGAAACSVLTNEKYFKGKVEHLRNARSVVKALPLLRKEFIVDSRQIYEARTIGADAILLIAACLSAEQCHEFAAMAHSVGLEVLLEIHTSDELKHISNDIDMIGVNNRNLGSFVTDVNNSFALAEELKQIANGRPLISESGIHEAETIKRLQQAGFNGFLIGEQFMKTPNQGMALAQLIAQL